MSNLWQVDIDPDSARIIGEPTRLTSLTGYNFRDLSVTTDGSRTAFVIEKNQPDVFVANVVDNGRQLSDVRQITFDERLDLPAGWSPDSQDVYFYSERGVDENVYARNVGGGDARVLSGTLRQGQDSAQLSPDGRWLLYWDLRDLHRVPIGGGPSEYILTGTRHSDFDCPQRVEANSTCVVSRVDAPNILTFYAFEPEYGLGRERFQIDILPPFTNWAMSPDRSKIAVVHNLGMIRVIDVETLDESVFTDPQTGFGEFIDWTGDGNGLILDARLGDGPRLKSLVYFDLAAEETHIIRDEPNQWHVRINVSHDGRQVAFGLMEFSGNAWMIENP
jgi:hypothetical protein